MHSPCCPTPPSPLRTRLRLRLVTAALCLVHPALPKALAPAELPRGSQHHPAPGSHTSGLLVFEVQVQQFAHQLLGNGGHVSEPFPPPLLLTLSSFHCGWDGVIISSWKCCLWGWVSPGWRTRQPSMIKYLFSQTYP